MTPPPNSPDPRLHHFLRAPESCLSPSQRLCRLDVGVRVPIHGQCGFSCQDDSDGAVVLMIGSSQETLRVLERSRDASM